MRDSILALGTLATLMTQDLAQSLTLGLNPSPPSDAESPTNQLTDAVPVADTAAIRPESPDAVVFAGDRAIAPVVPRVAPVGPPPAIAALAAAAVQQSVESAVLPPQATDPAPAESAVQTVATVAPTAPLAPSPAATFTDIQANPKALEISTLAAHGVVEGYEDGTFRPDAYVTEAEFGQMMQKAFSRSPEATPLFERPSGVITRAEAADFVYQKLLAAQSIAHDTAPLAAVPSTVPSTVAIAAPIPAPIAASPSAPEWSTPDPAPLILQAQRQAQQQLKQQLLSLTGVDAVTSESASESLPQIKSVQPSPELTTSQSMPPPPSPGLAAAIAPAIAPTTPERTGDRQSSSILRVSVMGAVNHPGLVQLPLNASLPTVLQAAGGLREPSAPHSLELIRLNDNGTITHQTLQADHQPAAIAPPALQNNDVVIVKLQNPPLLSQPPAAPLLVQLLDVALPASESRPGLLDH